jgi:hypothetical protein
MEYVLQAAAHLITPCSVSAGRGDFVDIGGFRAFTRRFLRCGPAAVSLARRRSMKDEAVALSKNASSGWASFASAETSSPPCAF